MSRPPDDRGAPYPGFGSEADPERSARCGAEGRGGGSPQAVAGRRPVKTSIRRQIALQSRANATTVK